MRVLVTGHAGYIGAVLGPLLQQGSDEVVGLDSGLYRDCDFWTPPVSIPEIEKDIRDIRPADLEGFEAVAHLAALSNDPLGDLDAELTYEINYKASVRLAMAAKEAGVSRFVFSSSCSTYGAAGSQAMIDEQGQFNPVTPYGRSKVLAEQEIVQLASDSFSPTFLRNATAYGVSPRLRLDVVLNNFVAWATLTGEIRMQSDGTPWRPLVHVEDIAQAFRVVLHAPRELVHGEAFNVGANAENYQIQELAAIVSETVPGCRVSYAAGAGPDTRCYRVDCSKMQRQLPDFEPRWDVRRGAQQLYEAYRRAGLTREDLEGARYTRIRCIRDRLEQGCVNASLRREIGVLASAGVRNS